MKTFAIVFSTLDNTDMANNNAESVRESIQAFLNEFPGVIIHSVIDTNTDEEIEINSDVFDFCKDHYETFNCYPVEMELSNGDILQFHEIMAVLTAEQKLSIDRNL